MIDKMKHTYIPYYIIHLFLWAGIVLTSCTDEVGLTPEGNGNEKPTVVTKSYVAVNLRTALEDAENTDIGLDPERKVNAVRIVLYDATVQPEDQMPVKYAFDFNIRSNYAQDAFEGNEDDLYQSEGPDQFITYAREVERQDYYMLVIINPDGNEQPYSPYNLKNVTAVDQTLSSFKTPIQIPDNNSLADNYYGAIAGDNHFIMTNHQGLVYVAAERLRKTPQEANENPIPVSVERMVAKIYVNTSNQFVVRPEGATTRIEDFRWELDCTNRKTFWMREMTYMKNGYMELQGLGSRADYYAKDPNFKLGEDWYSHSEEFFMQYPPYPNKFRSLLGEIQYTLENTMVAEDQAEDRITSVIVSAIYAPPGFKYGDSYFRYNDIAISLEQILWYKNTSFPLPTELEGLKEAIADLEASRGTTIDQMLQESFNECDIEYFKDGVNYYRIPIQHFGDQPEGAYGHYGVVRNNQYNITINSLTGPRSIGGGTASYISADIKVLPWERREQNNSVGDPTDVPANTPPSVN